MLTVLLYFILAVIVGAAIFFILARWLGRDDQLAAASRDDPAWHLGDGPLTADDVLGMRLPVALRGYRFQETDKLLDRLCDELRDRDDEIARLQEELAAADATESAHGTNAGRGANAAHGSNAAHPTNAGHTTPDELHG